MFHGYLKQSTASQTRTIGPFIDDTDFKSREDGLTIANTDIRLKKNGAADVAKNSGGGTADVNGMYAVTWDATDTDTVGQLNFSVVVSGALIVAGHYLVLEEAVYDALFGASALGYVANAPVTLADNAVALAKVASDLRLALGLIHTGTAAGIAAGTITLASGHGITNTRVLVFLQSGTNAAGKARVATYSGAGDVFNVSPPWDANGETTPSGTIVYSAVPLPRAAEDELTDQGLVLAQGTIGATGNDTTHLHLANLAYGDDEINDHLLVVLDVSTNVKYTTTISDWATTGDLATVPTLPFTPEASVDRYWLLSVKASTGSAPSAADIRAEMDSNSTQLAKLGVPAGASVSADIAAVQAEVDKIGTPAGASVSADIAAVKSDSAAILDDTGTSGVKVDDTTPIEVNIVKVNDVALVGDGNGTPWGPA